MNKLKFLVSLLLALGLVACPDDEDEKDDAKYSLKIAKPSTPKVGTAFSVEVKLYKGDALVTGDDAKGAKDADVSGSIKCAEHSAKVDLTKVKLSDAGKASFSVTIDKNSDAKGDAIGEKGYTDCVVNASTKFGDDNTEASGASDKFEVAPKTDDDGTVAVNTPKFDPVAPKFGQEFEITDGVGKKINIIAGNSTGACTTSNLFKLSGDPETLMTVGTDYKIVEDDVFFVIGTDCRVTVEGITAPQGFTDAGGGVAITTTLAGTPSKITVGFTATTVPSDALLFVKTGSDMTGNWTKATGSDVADWEATDSSLDSGVNSVTGTGNNHALLRANGNWTYDAND